MSDQNLSESKIETQSNSAASTLADQSSVAMKLDNSIAERQASNEDKVENKGAEPQTEVSWDGDHDPENPRNWSKTKKW